MNARRRLLALTGWFLAVSLWLTTLVAAQTPGLTLRLSKDWGYGGLGGDIQGTFSFHVEGPEDLVAVEFYIDDSLVGRVEQPPWKLRFVTDDYPLGQHTLYAIGYTAKGAVLKSNVLVRTFVPASEAWSFVIKIGVPILLLAFGIPALLYVIDRKRHPQKYSGYGGAFGGAICPHCGCPFPRHWWGLNFGSKKFDRCPHCGRWSLVGRASEDALARAAIDCGLEPPPEMETEADTGAQDLEKRLEESRYFTEE